MSQHVTVLLSACQRCPVPPGKPMALTAVQGDGDLLDPIRGRRTLQIAWKIGQANLAQRKDGITEPAHRLTIAIYTVAAKHFLYPDIQPAQRIQPGLYHALVGIGHFVHLFFSINYRKSNRRTNTAEKPDCTGAAEAAPAPASGESVRAHCVRLAAGCRLLFSRPSARNTRDAPGGEALLSAPQAALAAHKGRHFLNVLQGERRLGQRPHGNGH